MTGITNILLATGIPYASYVIVTASSGTFRGYQLSGPALGSLTPATFRGRNVRILGSFEFTFDLSIELSGSGLTQSFFTQIQVQDSTGAFRTYTSASASFAGGTSGNWNWGAGGGNLVYISGQTRSIGWL